MSSKNNRVWGIITVVFFCAAGSLLAQAEEGLHWEDLPSLPDSGYRGMSAGSSHGVWIAFGGEGHSAVSDRIYTLHPDRQAWQLEELRLPEPLAHALAVEFEDRIVVVGGTNGERPVDTVFSLKWKADELVIESLPALPVPLEGSAGARVGNELLVAGGSTGPDSQSLRQFLAFNLKSNEWTELDPWPGPGRAFAVSAVNDKAFLLFGGINSDDEPGILADGYRFSPDYQDGILTGGSWEQLAESPVAFAAAPSPAPRLGLDHFLILGGFQGPEFSRENLLERLYSYKAGSDQWVELGIADKTRLVAMAPVLAEGRRYSVIGGSDNADEFLDRVSTVFQPALHFGGLNWLAVMLYLGAVIVLGFWFSLRGQTTKDFFKAGERIPWWAAGISIYGTQLSGITFIALPPLVFAYDLRLVVGSLMIIAVAPLVIHFYLPFFRRLNVTSAYEYFEHRFDVNIRLFGSFTFIAMQLARTGVMLYLPALAISAVTGINIYTLILIMGVVSIVYTVLGGIEAVIWTDLLQVLVLLGGGMLCIGYVFLNTDGGALTVFQSGMADGKFKVLHGGWTPTEMVWWVALVGFFFINLMPYTSEQTVVQRYLTVKDERAAAKSIWTNGVMVIPAILIFQGLGIALYVFYKENPVILPAPEMREIVPYFVVHKLPVGIAGLVIAGLFAASMSSIDSNMNSVSTAFTTDVIKRFRPEHADEWFLRRARWLTIFVGVFGTVSAMGVAWLDVQFLFELSIQIVSIIGSSLAGIFVLGIFTRRANARGTAVGIVASVATTLSVWQFTQISLYLYATVGVVTCVSIGYLASLLVGKGKNLDGLTYRTLNVKR
ncbi:MAG: sodium/solute symporter [Opitutales bacterium]|nr:sodium/solute symporter [Opitutales bacterium]